LLLPSALGPQLMQQPTQIAAVDINLHCTTTQAKAAINTSPMTDFVKVNH
jgi:hypothetical protein